MNVMFEVYYSSPRDLPRENRITQAVGEFGGRLDFLEEPNPGDAMKSICLTYVFPNRAKAELAAEYLRKLGEYMEGPQDYPRDI